MKRILLFLAIAFSGAAYGQAVNRTYARIDSFALKLRNETVPHANTPNRVGDWYRQVAFNMVNKNEIYTNPAFLVLTQVITTNGFTFIDNNATPGLGGFFATTNGPLQLQGNSVLLNSQSTFTTSISGAATMQASGGWTFSGGRTTFTPFSSYSGLNWGSIASDPTSINADGWYNSSTHLYKGKQNGTVVTFATSTSNLSLFAATTSAQLRALLSDESGGGLAYFQGGDIGTPSAGVGTNLTGTASGFTAGNATKWTTGRTIGITGDVTYTSPSLDGSGNVTAAGTVTRVNGIAFSGLATGILKNTTTTGVPSIAVAGTDYQAPITLTTTGTSGAATLVSNTLNIPQYAGAGGITALTGDVTASGTGSVAATVVKINGVSLSGLATGILKNTTTTGVPSIAVAGTDYQIPITLTTTGTSGAATFSSGTLNIPQYTGGGGGNPFADNTGIIKNNADNTKIVRLSAASVTTATTRVWTFPDRDDTFIGISDLLSAVTGSSLGYATAIMYNDWYTVLNKADYAPNSSVISSGSSSTISNATNKSPIVVTFDFASVAASYNVTTPSTPIDGQVLILKFGPTITSGNPEITSFTVTANTSQAVRPAVSAVLVNSDEVYAYSYTTSNTTWTRINTPGSGGGSGWSSSTSTTITGNTSQSGAFNNTAGFNSYIFTQPTQATGVLGAMVINPGTMTSATLSTQVSALTLNTRTINHATGAITATSDVVLTGSTHTATAASVSTTTMTLDVTAPINSTNFTSTNLYAARFTGNVNFVGDLLTTGAARKVGTLDGQVLNIVTTNLARIQIAANGSQTHTMTVSGSSAVMMTMTTPAHSGGTQGIAQWVGGAYTAQATTVEINDLFYNGNRTVTWATGAIAQERFVRFDAPTIAFAGSSTVGTAATLAISGPPAAGTNATVSNSAGLFIAARAVGAGTTHAYSLWVQEPTGASTDNFAALFTGHVMINHLVGGTGTGTTPTAGTGAGTGPTVSSQGTDMAGSFTVVTGTTPAATATVVTMAFSSSYIAAPKSVILTPANAAAAALATTSLVYIDVANITSGQFVVTSQAALAASTTYKWYYQVVQ